MDKRKLFVASCISLLTTSMVFAIRGDIEGALSSSFLLSKEQIGLIWGPAFWGFTIAIFLSGFLVDMLGMRILHVLSGAGYIGGVALVLAAPFPEAPVESIFSELGTSMLYFGFLAMGLSQGLVEGVINPLIATLYREEKAKKLNVLHAWWPGGMIIGGLTAFCLSQFDVSWQIKLSTIMIPAFIYLAMVARQKYPVTERVASSITTADMFKEATKPLFVLLFACMWLTAAMELGPDQWFPSIMKSLTDVDGIVFLVYTAGLMFVLRFFFGGVVEKYSPFGVLTVCAVLAGVGLLWLGSLEVGSSAAVAFIAATVFGVGKTYFWPTMLGVVAERFPKGGALLINLVGGAGMLSIAFVLPYMGAQFDAMGAGAALQSVSGLGVVLAVIFGALYFFFRLKGGYKAVRLDEAAE